MCSYNMYVIHLVLFLSLVLMKEQILHHNLDNKTSGHPKTFFKNFFGPFLVFIFLALMCNGNFELTANKTTKALRFNKINIIIILKINLNLNSFLKITKLISRKILMNFGCRSSHNILIIYILKAVYLVFIHPNIRNLRSASKYIIYYLSIPCPHLICTP